MRELILIALLTTLTLINFIYHSKAKKELNNQIKYSQKLLLLAEKIKSLNKKATPPHFCKQKEKVIICKNLTKSKFYIFEEFLSKVNIKSLDIEKNKTINAKVTIQ